MPADLAPLLKPDGARNLAHRIEQYWAERGMLVITEIFDAYHKSDKRVDRDINTDHSSNPVVMCVRSDMINGMPREVFMTGVQKWLMTGRLKLSPKR